MGRAVLLGSIYFETISTDVSRLYDKCLLVALSKPQIDVVIELVRMADWTSVLCQFTLEERARVHSTYARLHGNVPVRAKFAERSVCGPRFQPCASEANKGSESIPPFGYVDFQDKKRASQRKPR